MSTPLSKCTPIPCPEPGSAEWLDARRNFVGGSDVAAIMGLNPYRNARDVWMDKTGRGGDNDSNLAMRAGTFMEPFILAEYERATGRKGVKPTAMYQSNDHSWLAANLDWLSEDYTLVADAKRSEAPQLWGESGTDEVPVGYFMQMQAYMLITGIEAAELAALLPRNDLRIYPIQPDTQIQNRIVEATGEFWDKYVKTDTPPPIDEAMEGTLASVKRLYNRVEPEKVTLPDPLSITVERFMQVKNEIKALSMQKDSLESIILDQIGNAESAEIPGRYAMTRKQVIKKPYLCTPKPYTMLRIKEITE